MLGEVGGYTPSEAEARSESLRTDEVQVEHVTEKSDKLRTPSYRLYFGSKRVDVYMQPVRNFVGNYIHVDTYVENIEGRERLPNETTTLYTKLRELCQNIADLNECDVKYLLKTSYPQIAEWALTKGSSIFHWNKINSRESYGENWSNLSEDHMFYAECTLNPTNAPQGDANA